MTWGMCLFKKLIGLEAACGPLHGSILPWPMAYISCHRHPLLVCVGIYITQIVQHLASGVRANWESHLTWMHFVDMKQIVLAVEASTAIVERQPGSIKYSTYACAPRPAYSLSLPGSMRHLKCHHPLIGACWHACPQEHHASFATTYISA